MPFLNNSLNPLRRAIIVADDFGSSGSVNRAVIEAHLRGVLTCASLMVGGEAWEEAVQLAKAHPSLGVGLHLTLARGRSVLPWKQIPHLANQDGLLDDSPVRAGWRCFVNDQVRKDLDFEIRAQFERFRSTGLPLDHVNGHLNMHLHPSVLPRILKALRDVARPMIRLTRDPLRMNLLLARGRWSYRLSHWAIFGILSLSAKSSLDKAGVGHADRVFGLLQSGDMNRDYVMRLLHKLPAGVSELYFHPETDGVTGNVDLECLVHPDIRRSMEERGVVLIRYSDL